MATAKNRKFLTVSTPAHEHLMNVVARLEKKGLPTSGTMIASKLLLNLDVTQAIAILSMDIPQPHAVKAADVTTKSKRSKATVNAVVPAAL